MSEELVNTLVFIFVFVVVPWGFIFGLRLIGRRRGYESQYARRRSRRPTGRFAAG
jgi:hypothetical protein